LTLSDANRSHDIGELKASSKVVCVVSGGLDSVCTAAYLKKEKKCSLYFISYIYGQRAKNEVLAAKRFARILKVKDHHTIDIGFMKQLYSNSNALTNPRQRLPGGFDYSIVVPIRNFVFISIASAWALSLNATAVAYGAHVGDSHYPDCRPKFIRSVASVLNLAEEDGMQLGMRQKITVWAPVLQGMSKTQLLKIGYSILGDEIFETWSCYSNGTKFKGNYLHCGWCESCINRKVAIRKAGLEDLTMYAKNE
jgi:7-cyano-7-deazaguanine synthase